MSASRWSLSTAIRGVTLTAASAPSTSARIDVSGATSTERDSAKVLECESPIAGRARRRYREEFLHRVKRLLEPLVCGPSFGERDLGVADTDGFGQVVGVRGCAESDCDCGIGPSERADEWGERISGQAWERCDIEMSGDEARDGSHGGRRDGHIAQRAPCGSDEGFPGGCQEYAVAGTHEELGSEFVFEFAYRERHGGLGNVRGAGRGGEAVVVDDGDEQGKASEIHTRIVWYRAILGLGLLDRCGA